MSSRVKFWICVLVLFLLCGALSAIGWLKLYDAAVSYEHSSPEYVTNGILSLYQNGEYEKLLELSGLELSKFEKIKHFADAIEKAAPEGEYNFKKSGENSYLLLRGKTELAELYLKCDKSDSEYGFDVWQADKISLIAAAPKDYIIMAPGHLKLFANDIKLSDKNIDKAAGEHELLMSKAVFGDLPEEYFPSTSSFYTIKGLFNEPDIKPADLDKKFYSVKRDDTNITLLLTPTKAIVKKMTEFGAEAACMYARFITNDADFRDVKKYFLPQSPYYTHLSEFYNDWYNDHDSYSFEDPVLSDWLMYDDYHVTCSISFNYRIKMGKREFEYPSKYNMAFVRTADGWKVSNLIVV